MATSVSWIFDVIISLPGIVQHEKNSSVSSDTITTRESFRVLADAVSVPNTLLCQVFEFRREVLLLRRLFGRYPTTLVNCEAVQKGSAVHGN